MKMILGAIIGGAICFGMLLPLTVSASQSEDTDGKSVQQEAIVAPDTIEPPDWGDNNEFESSFDGGEPSFGEDGDESN